MASATSIKGLIQGIAAKDGQLIIASVLSISPLRLQAADDEKLLISGRIVYVPEHLTDHSLDVTLAGSYESMTVNAGLKVGDKVYLLSLSGGKHYFALGRV